jgi:hypothetical protein
VRALDADLDPDRFEVRVDPSSAPVDHDRALARFLIALVRRQQSQPIIPLVGQDQDLDHDQGQDFAQGQDRDLDHDHYQERQDADVTPG